MSLIKDWWDMHASPWLHTQQKLQKFPLIVMRIEHGTLTQRHGNNGKGRLSFA